MSKWWPKFALKPPTVCSLLLPSPTAVSVVLRSHPSALIGHVL